MVLSLIVAASENGVIGQASKMPWRLPAEMACFKRITMGHPVISGRKNYEAMGRPLPGRLNIVITRQTNYQVPQDVVVVHSIDEALAQSKVASAREVFIIGGGEIYEQAMPLADNLYLSTVHTKIEGDTFFRYEPEDWHLEWSEHHPADAQNKYAFTLQLFSRL